MSAATIARAARTFLPGKDNAGLRAEIRRSYAVWQAEPQFTDDDGVPVGDVDGSAAILNVGRRVALTASGHHALAQIAKAAREEM